MKTYRVSSVLIKGVIMSILPLVLASPYPNLENQDELPEEYLPTGAVKPINDYHNPALYLQNTLPIPDYQQPRQYSQLMTNEPQFNQQMKQLYKQGAHQDDQIQYKNPQPFIPDQSSSSESQLINQDLLDIYQNQNIENEQFIINHPNFEQNPFFDQPMYDLYGIGSQEQMAKQPISKEHHPSDQEIPQQYQQKQNELYDQPELYEHDLALYDYGQMKDQFSEVPWWEQYNVATDDAVPLPDQTYSEVPTNMEREFSPAYISEEYDNVTDPAYQLTENPGIFEDYETYYGGASSNQPDEPSSSSSSPDSPTLHMSLGEMNKRGLNKPPEFIQTTNCQIPLNKLPLNHGIITDNRLKFFIYPFTNDIITVEHGKSIMVSCPGTESYLKLKGEDSQSSMVLICKESQLRYGPSQREVAFDEYECTKEPQPIFVASNKKNRGDLCAEGFTQFKIGLRLYRSIPSFIEICLNNRNKRAVEIQFVMTYLGKDLQGQESYGEFQGYIHSRPEDKKYSLLFNWSTQRTSLFDQLGKEKYDEMNQSIIRSVGQDNYQDIQIVPGRLAGLLDHVLRIGQVASNFWINLQPQWSNLNKNWTEVEIAVSKFAANRDAYLVVYSGVYGHQFFKGSDGRKTYLYLGYNSTLFTFKYQPIASHFWKLLYDPQTNSCVAIVGYNSPYIDENEMMACSDVTEDITWLNTLRPGFENGVVYTCSCLEFNPTRINLTVDSLLTK